MRSLLIGAAAYLKIIRKYDFVDTEAVAVIAFSKGDYSEPFYNKEAGIAVVEKSLKNHNIIKEEATFLKTQIIDSKMMDRPTDALDEAFEDLKERVKHIKNNHVDLASEDGKIFFQAILGENSNEGPVIN